MVPKTSKCIVRARCVRKLLQWPPGQHWHVPVGLRAAPCLTKAGPPQGQDPRARWLRAPPPPPVPAASWREHYREQAQLGLYPIAALKKQQLSHFGNLVSNAVELYCEVTIGDNPRRGGGSRSRWPSTAASQSTGAPLLQQYTRVEPAHPTDLPLGRAIAAPSVRAAAGGSPVGLEIPASAVCCLLSAVCCLN
jgi:hypothetical protein